MNTYLSQLTTGIYPALFFITVVFILRILVLGLVNAFQAKPKLKETSVIVLILSIVDLFIIDFTSDFTNLLLPVSLTNNHDLERYNLPVYIYTSIPVTLIYTLSSLLTIPMAFFLLQKYLMIKNRYLLIILSLLLGLHFTLSF